MIAYTGYDDKLLGYQISGLYVMNRDGSKPKLISKGFDRNVQSIRWAADGKGFYFQYSDKGNGKIGYMDMKGKSKVLTHNLGGGGMGRPILVGAIPSPTMEILPVPKPHLSIQLTYLSAWHQAQK